ncbi:hypothetical protein K432DRAFT_377631 [Lepidopterella palustris CBS 459.81]|uniref:Uncharacterized protein n=1 Tax=Lepidopterella palustris CBS 459.81 TaxID=1314670 RepID=A0A8E2EKE8_9PEZI|nr:hypothetical protein K432DRAFT_377631 [Lepidopterella palustris CBS 459.81]
MAYVEPASQPSTPWIWDSSRQEYFLQSPNYRTYQSGVRIDNNATDSDSEYPRYIPENQQLSRTPSASGAQFQSSGAQFHSDSNSQARGCPQPLPTNLTTSPYTAPEFSQSYSAVPTSSTSLGNSQVYQQQQSQQAMPSSSGYYYNISATSSGGQNNPYYQPEQSDDDYQRHLARKRHNQGQSQDLHSGHSQSTSSQSDPHPDETDGP